MAPAAFLTNVPTSTLSRQVAFDEVNMMVYAVVGGLAIFPLP